ncbi:MAG: hypothetical protein ACP5RH_13870, partial [Leptodesmis sp.]|uniref:hypothetical protein n=1 Tax=Leptodesmis sp. TaxID=3100501 RepID=UPI003D0B56AC
GMAGLNGWLPLDSPSLEAIGSVFIAGMLVEWSHINISIFILSVIPLSIDDPSQVLSGRTT